MMTSNAKQMPKVKHLFLRLSAMIRGTAWAEKNTLLAVCLTAFLLYVFVELAEDVVEGDTQSFDKFVLLALREKSDPSNPVGPQWLEEVMRDFTSLGSPVILLTITLITAGFLVLTRKRHAAWMIMCSVASGILVSILLKWGFARPRPDAVMHATVVYTQSFPSGHAMLSAVVYLTLGALLARTQVDVKVKIYLLTVATVLTVIVGVSRIYLGVHWPTDVLAGWAGGAGWALLCWLAMIWLQSKGKIEMPTAAVNGNPPSSRD